MQGEQSSTFCVQCIDIGPLLYRILCKGKTKERVSLTMCCRHGPSSERVKRIRHLFIICCMEAKGLLFFCKFFFPKRYFAGSLMASQSIRSGGKEKQQA